MLDIYPELGFTLHEEGYHDLDLYTKGSVALIVMKKFKENKKDFRVASNHLDERLIKELMRAFKGYETRSDIHSVILTSAHKVAFSRGAKIELLLENTTETIREFIKVAQGLVIEIQNFPKPVIAALNGFALGGGLELIMTCDYRISSSRENAVFGLPEALLGVIPAMGGTQNLPRLIGADMARDVISKGRVDFDAIKAKEAGLVDDICEPEDLINKAYDLASQEGLQKKVAPVTGEITRTPEEMQKEIHDYLMTHPLTDPSKIKVAPFSEAMAHFLIDHWEKGNLAQGLAYEIEAFLYLHQTEDCREGIEALIAERPAQFKGH